MIVDRAIGTMEPGPPRPCTEDTHRRSGAPGSWRISPSWRWWVCAPSCAAAGGSWQPWTAATYGVASFSALRHSLIVGECRFPRCNVFAGYDRDRSPGLPGRSGDPPRYGRSPGRYRTFAAGPSPTGARPLTVDRSGHSVTMTSRGAVAGQRAAVQRCLRRRSMREAPRPVGPRETIPTRTGRQGSVGPEVQGGGRAFRSASPGHGRFLACLMCPGCGNS